MKLGKGIKRNRKVGGTSGLFQGKCYGKYGWLILTILIMNVDGFGCKRGSRIFVSVLVETLVLGWSKFLLAFLCHFSQISSHLCRNFKPLVSISFLQFFLVAVGTKPLRPNYFLSSSLEN